MKIKIEEIMGDQKKFGSKIYRLDRSEIICLRQKSCFLLKIER
jgi:predicted RNA-binding protein